jgi:sterol desaturase/sphingolipid hydroxylase (fatty acid hydroxylase superfamily)
LRDLGLLGDCEDPLRCIVPVLPKREHAEMGSATGFVTGPGRLKTHDVVIAAATATIFFGALMVRSRLIFGLAVLAAIFVPMERMFALHSQRVFRAGWRTDLVHFVVNNLLTTFLLILAVLSVGTAMSAVVPGALRSAVGQQPLCLQTSEAFVLAGLSGYWAHRATHRVPVLWKFHRVHHSVTEMDWLAAGRLHPVDQAFTRSCTVLPLVALGFTKGVLGAFVVLITFQALFIHANVRFRFGPLRWIVATPEFHHWHHSADPAAYNSNFAGEFPWLDLLFGTLHLPAGKMPEGYGIQERPPKGYLYQLAWPFRRTSRTASPGLLTLDVDPTLPY